MDDYDVSLGVPVAANVDSVGDRQQLNQQKKQEKRKKQKKKPVVNSQDVAIISGQTLKTRNKAETKDDEPPGKGEFIDIQA